MAGPVKLHLSATVTHRDNERLSRCPTVTVCSIHLSGVVVAGATLGGTWTPAQVLREFVKRPARFKPGTAYEAGLLAAKAG